MTVTLFTSPSCTSCRKAKRWLQDNDIPFTEQNIFVQAPSVRQLKWILSLTENGTEETMWKRSKDYTKLNTDVDMMSVSILF